MPQNIYEVEIDGKVYELEGDREPTEQEARAAIAQYSSSPAPSMPSLHAAASGYAGPTTEDGKPVGESGFLGDLNRMLEPVAKPWSTPDQDEQMSNLSSLLVPATALSPAAAKNVAPMLGKPVQRAGKWMEQTGDTLRNSSDLSRWLRHGAAAAGGGYMGGREGAAIAAALDLMVPPALQKVGRGVQKAGRFMRGTTALDDIPVGQRPRLVKNPQDPLAEAMTLPDDLPESVSLPETPEMPRSGWTKDAGGNRVYTSDIESGRHDIPTRGIQRPPSPNAGGKLVQAQAPETDPLVEDLLNSLKGETGSVELPAGDPMPSGGWTKNAAGDRVYTSDKASGAHDIPARGTPKKPAPKAESAPAAKSGSSEPMMIGGQKIKESDPLFAALQKAMGESAKPAPSHVPSTAGRQPLSNRFEMPKTQQEWIDARRMYGSKKLAQLTGKTRDEIKKLAPGPSRTPLEAEERIRAFNEKNDKPFWSRD